MAAFPILRQPRSIVFAITAEARVLQMASLSFDASISEIATVLTRRAAAWS